jgi:hypothetical protein
MYVLYDVDPRDPEGSNLAKRVLHLSYAYYSNPQVQVLAPKASFESLITTYNR